MVKQNWMIVAVIAVVALMLFSYLGRGVGPSTATADVSYSNFRALLAEDQIASVVFRGDDLQAQLDATVEVLPGVQADQVTTRVPPEGHPALLAELEQRDVEITALPEQEGGWLASLLPWLLLIGVYVFFWSRLSRNMPGGVGRGGFDRFLKGRAGQEDTTARKVTFGDVAGQDNAKAEVAELVEFLRDPERYRQIGAEPPRGILLMGPPGTGKTLLARALAGEAGVPFFSISASEFIEMFVGVGASRVRAMFNEAKKRAPAIIFIDELDAVGRVRGAGVGGGHDEREQTLNQILSEMDGFAGHEAVIVLAATNRPDVLDPALLRPGRFDRHVTLDLPDRAAREEILKVHVRGKPLADDVDLTTIAAGTPGFSGADLKNLVNEAAIACARERRTTIAMQHVDQARDRVMMGLERHLTIRPEEKHRLAVHESGHTAVAHYLPNADPVYKVTIIPRGRALGGTHMLPTEERYTQSTVELRDRLAVMLAGRASEAALLGDVSSGADDDIRQATHLARAMVSRWGMSDKLGPMDLRQSEEHPFLGREISQAREFSDETAHQVDEEVRSLLREAETRATELIVTHRPRIEALVAALEQHETLNRDTIVELLKVPAEAGRVANA
ncbi:MAG: ATP-dependent zinc metalloprotease FtsH [Alphaproteobacteria bacterium]